MRSLGVLLPVTSKGSSLAALADGLQGLAAACACPGPGHTAVRFVLGLDEDDPLLGQQQEEAGAGQLVRALGAHRTTVVYFRRADLDAQQEAFAPTSPGPLPLTPICWMWQELARVAVQQQGVDAFVLLGDDVKVAPGGWPQHAMAALEQLQPVAQPGGAGQAAPRSAAPMLGCVVLVDGADPGYPSFPVLGAGHLAAMDGSLVPPGLFINQQADPFLSELYRRCGLWTMCPEVRVHNERGGLELPGDTAYAPPLYARAYAPKPRVMEALGVWGPALLAWARSHGHDVHAATSVDVLIPCGRADAGALRRIIERAQMVDPALRADVRFGLVVDCTPDEATRLELQALRDSALGRVRLRFHPRNLGAPATRNKALEESMAQYVIFFDDDVEPGPFCVEAYVRAMQDHPNDPGFVGPTFLPKPWAFEAAASGQEVLRQQPGPAYELRLTAQVLALGLHMSDCAYFWEAALTLANEPGARLPWGVTANLALRNTGRVFFNPCFPKTGGGEDVDACLTATGGAGLLCVPEAQATHPLWGGGRSLIWRRFFLWSVGDSQLVDLHPALTYRVVPSGLELCLLWLLLVLLLALPAALAGWWAPRPAALLLPPLFIVVSDALIDQAREIGVAERRARHACPSKLLRTVACLYATSIKWASEAGKVFGHVRRHGWARGLARVGVRFDWFGALPRFRHVPRKEQWWAACRCAVHAAAAASVVCACW